MDIARVVDALLAERGISAYRLSKDTGISAGNVTDWRKGRSQPKIEALVKLADYFKVSTDYLLGRQCGPDPPPHAAPFDRPDFDGLDKGEMDKLADYARYLKSQRK